jgi:hypothetical protein
VQCDFNMGSGPCVRLSARYDSPPLTSSVRACVRACVRVCVCVCVCVDTSPVFYMSPSRGSYLTKLRIEFKLHSRN